MAVSVSPARWAVVIAVALALAGQVVLLLITYVGPDRLAAGRWIALGGTALSVLVIAFAAAHVHRKLARQEHRTRELAAQATGLRDAVDARTRELSELSTHLQNVAEREKASLARELHDELGGTLTGAKMDLSWLRRRADVGDAEQRVRWQRLEKALESGMNLKRRVVEQLRPTLLDNLGFYAAARWAAEETCGTAGLRCHLDLAEPEPILDQDRAIALFRVLQESLNNVVEHAAATAVWITLECDESSGRLRLIVRDDGRGAAADRLRALESHGLASMRHRMRANGGQFNISAPPGGGTEVMATCPFTSDAADSKLG
jgi:signal transduction histidine kinase